MNGSTVGLGPAMSRGVEELTQQPMKVVHALLAGRRVAAPVVVPRSDPLQIGALILDCWQEVPASRRCRGRKERSPTRLSLAAWRP